MKIKVLIFTILTLLSVGVFQDFFKEKSPIIERAHAATCTSINYTSSSANSVLTSSKYNTDHSTTYNFLNSYDAGCIATGTLEYDALNTTQFAPVLKGTREGCKLSATDSNTISVDRCLLGVNGQFVATTVATSVTWGCSGCSSPEASSTKYYVYAASGSSGTTLTLKILTGAPNGDGYDGSGNRVLGAFYNNSSSNIQGVQQWVNGGLVAPRSFYKVNDGNGHGSSSTKIRRYTNIIYNIGTALTCVDSASLGLTCTVNEEGVYQATIQDQTAGANAVCGISINSNQLTTSVETITASTSVGYSIAVSNSICSFSAPIFAVSGDVIRPHTGGNNDNSSANDSMFTIAKVSD